MPTPETSPDDELLAATERWFLARGIPHLIEDYRASENVFTRMGRGLIRQGRIRR